MKTTFTPFSSINRLFWRGVAMVAFALVLLYSSDLKASHIVGGDITYECLGNNKYEITLNVYRDCFYGDPGAWFDNPAYVGVYRKSNNTLFQQVNMYFSGINDTLSNFITDTCLFVPPAVCVHVTQYKKIVTIPYDASGYELVYQRCCRNITVQNIMDPFHTGATYCVTLSGPAMQQCNSTPNFGGVAPIYICVNQPLYYDHSAIDPDGDSLVYKLHTPLIGGSFTNAQPIPPNILPPLQTVTWIDPPYNEQNMLGASVPLAIDPQTGILTALPTIQGQFVVGIAVEEYRNGVWLSTVRRDFQYNIGECGEVISSFFADAQCENLAVNFQNNSTFANEFLWYFDWGGDLSLTSTEVNPNFIFPDTGWYTVALIAEPTSQCVDTSFHDIYLQNNSLFVDFDVTVFDCVDTNSVLELYDLSFDTISAVIAWDWEVTWIDTLSVDTFTLTSILQNPVLLVPQNIAGTITLTATSINGCVQSLSLPFETGVDDDPISLIPDSHIICFGDSANLNPNADSIGPYPYYWEPDSLFTDPTSPNQIVSPDSSTVYTVYITAIDSLCYAQADIEVTVIPIPSLGFDFEVDCNGRTVNFTNNGSSSEGYFWDFGDLSTLEDTSSLVNPIYSYPDTGTYLITLSTGLNASCPDTVILELVLEDNILEAAFSYELNDCEIDSVVVYFTDQTQNDLNNTIAWEWVFGDLGTSDQQNPTLTVFQSDTLEVMYTITTAENCQDSITEEIIVLLPEDEFIVDSIVICPGDSAELNPGGNPDLVYQWLPIDGLSDATAANPVATPTQTTTYTVTVSVPDQSTCFITREVKVTVPPELNLMNSGNVTTCDPQVTLTASTDAPAIITWVSNPGNNTWTGTEITVDVTGITEYTITAEDAFGCVEETTLTVQGGPVDYSISADSIIVCTDEPFDVFVTNLDPNDVLSYMWAPDPAILSGGNTNDPVISNAPGQTVLYVNMENQFGCVANDSVYVAIVDEDIQLDFDYEIVDCDGLEVQFINLSQNGYDFVWDFGDPSNPGAISYEDNPSYTYPDTGTYQVTLNIIYNPDCVDPVTKPVVLEEALLHADFIYDYTDCEEDTVTITFDDQSESFLDDITNWDWTFSNGDTSTAQNPVLTLSQSQILTATLVITTALDCVDSVSYDIPIELTEINLADTLILCPGDTLPLNPLGNTSYQYNWSPDTGLSDPTVANPDVFVSQTTTYTVDIINFTGDTCEITRTVTVIVPEIITLDAAGGEAIACNEPITLNVVANVSPIDLIWTNTSGDTIGTGTSVVVSPTNTSTYYVEGVDEYGCSAWDTVIVTVPTQIDVVIEGNFISCQTTVDLTAISNADPVTFQWFENGTPFGGDTSTVSVNPGTSSIYTVIATDTFGCQATADSLVTVPEAIDMEVSEDQVSCQDSVSLSVSANVPLNYVWTTNLTFVDTAANITVQPDSTSWYVVVGTDAFGCIAVDSTLVTVPPPVAVIIEGEMISCQDTVSLQALSTVDPVTYQWYADTTPFGGNIDIVYVNPNQSTTYTVVVTDTFGCVASDTTVLIVPETIDMEVSDNQISCQTPVNLSVSGNVPLDYVWTVNQVFVDTAANITVQPGVTSWYVVTGTDSLGCFAVDSVLVTVPPPISVSVSGDMVSCQEEVTLQALSTVTPVTYEWYVNNTQFGGNTDIVTVNPGMTTTYTVIVTDTFGCVASDTALVLVPNQIVLSISEDQISCQTEVTLTANGNVTLSYEWWANSELIDTTATIIVNPDTSTTFYVFVTDSLGCHAAASTTVTVPETIEMQASADTTACEGPVEISATGNVPLEFEWWMAGSIDSTAGTPITVLPDTTGWWYVLGTDDFGCEALDSVFVINGIVDIQAEGQVIVCPVDSLTLEVSNIDPFDALSYVWSAGPGGAILSDSTLSIVTVSTIVGPVEFYVTAINQFGCSTTDTVEVVMSDFEPTFNDTVHVCAGIPTEINPGANPNYTYNWEPEIGGLDPNSPNPTVTLYEDQTFSVTITDFFGVDTCSAVLEVIVLVNPDIQLEAQGDTTLCEFVPTTLTATTGVTPVDLSWYDDPALSNEIGQGSSIVVDPVGNSIYYVIAEDALGCLDTAMVEIDAFPIDISALSEDLVCLLEELTLNVINNASDQELTYQWSPDSSIVVGGNTPTPTVNPTVTTTYTVVVENQYGCIDSASTTVNVIDVITSLFATADPDTILFNSGLTSQLETIQDDDYTYWWWPDENMSDNTIYNPVVEPDSTTTYYVEITDENGCRGVDSVTVVVLDPPCEPPYIFVPTGFTPNGDGENDVLYVRGNSIDVVYFAVYSRWGELIFETEDMAIGWDGTVNGKEVPPDVFGWYLQAKCFNGEEFFDKGNVTLLR